MHLNALHCSGAKDRSPSPRLSRLAPKKGAGVLPSAASKKDRSPSSRLSWFSPKKDPGVLPAAASKKDNTIAASGLVDSVSVAKFKASKNKISPQQGGLTPSLPLEEFYLMNLIDCDPDKLVVVAHTEQIVNVLELMRRSKCSSCVVNLASGEQDFFDCMGFGSYLLEVITGGASSPEDLRTAAADWHGVKRKLLRVAQEPVRKALRRGLARSGQSGGETATGSFCRFDSDQTLESLIPLLKSQRPVPIFRGADLYQTLSASDVLDICLSMADESRQMLECMPLKDIIARTPTALSKVNVAEDQTLLEVINLMRQANVHVVPIVGSMEDGNDVQRPLVGQFDIASLRSLYVKVDKEREDGVSVGQWWWEAESVTSNLFMETCLDFLCMCPALEGEGQMKDVPFAAVLSSEPLTKAISRCITSPHHSVVVYQVDAQNAASSSGSRSKPLEGLASSLSLVTSMLDAGLFQQLVFDTSKPASVRKVQHLLRRPTLTVNSVKVALEQSEVVERSTRITFNSTIGLERLIVPTCPHHTVRFLRFTKEEDANRAMDFSGLKDSHYEPRAFGATSSCMACQRSLGKVVVACEPLSPPSPVNGIPRSALKAGSPGIGYRAVEAAQKSQQSTDTKSPVAAGELVIHSTNAEATVPSSNSWLFGVFCCGSQCTTAKKEFLDVGASAAVDRGLRNPPGGAADLPASGSWWPNGGEGDPGSRQTSHQRSKVTDVRSTKNTSPKVR